MRNKATASTQNCGNCAYCVKEGDTHSHLCCYLPPQVFGWGGQMTTAWPKVALDDWCGQWKQGATP
jgi:hypothetical protein